MSNVSRRDVAKFGAVAAFAAMMGRPGFAVDTDPLANVDPELRSAAEAVLRMRSGYPPLSDKELPNVRARSAAAALPPRSDVPVEQRQIPGKSGSPAITLFIVNSSGDGGRKPVIVHTHGGGFIAGSAKAGLARLQELAMSLDCVVVSIAYRLAPETRFSGSTEDNYAGLLWVYLNARTLGIDPNRIAVMGESAGGGHAALLAINARDRGEVPILFQSLIYPMLDDRTGTTRSVPAHIGKIGWTSSSNRYGWQSFLGEQPGKANIPKAAVPARQVSLAGLPPAFIGVGGIDLFVEEDIAYALRLTQAGIATELLVVPGAFHGFDGIAKDSGPSKRFTAAKIDALRRAFATNA